MKAFAHKHRAVLWAGLAAAACLLAALLVWLAEVRPNAAKVMSESICDDYTAVTPLDEGAALTQTFATDSDLLTMAFVFETEGAPAGTLHLTLTDAATGAVLARSTGNIAAILPGQYTGLGLDTPVQGQQGRQYAVTLSAAYDGPGRLALCHSDGALLWDESLTLDGSPVDGTAALLLGTRRIGGFLTRFFLLVSAAAALLVFAAVWAALREKLALHRLVFALVLGFGLLYGLVLPPYAAPDEKYHINQSFTLACRWANLFSPEDWRMGQVPLDTSYRREHDFNALLQNERTTVFTWQETVDQLFTVTQDSFDSHVMLEELQTDANPIPYLPSAAAVFLAFLLHLGFVPALYLGRLANLLVFAALAALAVRRAPCGRRVFAAAALLPMTLHLAVSFSRDALLLGFCFAFTALLLNALCGGRTRPMPGRETALLFALGLLLAPSKAVYLPLAALVLLVPGARLARYPAIKKAAYLIGCLALTLVLNSGVLLGAVSAGGAAEPAAAPAEQAAESSAARARPVPANADYESTIRANTAENYVKRLYFYFENTTDVSDSEAAFWAQALREGDLSAAELAQSFLFSPAQMNDAVYTDDQFVSAASKALLGYDVMEGSERAAYRSLLNNYGRIMTFKDLYSRTDFQQRCLDMGAAAGGEDAEAYPLDRQDLQARVEAARATRASQSVATAEDLVRYTPAYILSHPADTALLAVRSLVENGDHYLRTLVGGSLSYYSVEIAWVWVVLLYLLLLLAAQPEADESAVLPAGSVRVWLALAALACCGLAVAGCITWTPVSHTTIYGLQGRYFLPVLPLLLLTCLPRGSRAPKNAAGCTVALAALANAGVLGSAMLAVIAR